jgi:hypothetical protein
MAASPSTGVFWGRRGALTAGAGLFLLAAVFLWKRQPDAPAPPTAPRPADPRLEYSGPFQNVRPEVHYVGDARCADCHEDITRSYHEHPMARSLLPVGQASGGQLLDADHHNPFEALGRRFWVERREGRVLHGQVPAVAGDSQRSLEVAYVIGSGIRGHSYLTDHDGYLFQTPISWYAEKKLWDLSPGFREATLPERPVAATCLFCHANRALADEETENHYQAPIFQGHGIGCERCHGPGELHADNPGRRDPQTGADPTIVNPRRLEPALREAVCEQCHLAGEVRLLCRGRGLYDFRPGLSLGQFWAIFVQARKPGQEEKAVNHVEQMYLSRCFQASAGRMGCVSCHDPHRAVGPERRVTHYRGRCLACHEEHGCGLPLEERRRTQADDSCIACHMPRYDTADIAHAAATNHRIVRRPPSPDARQAHPGVSGEAPPGVVSFYGGRLAPSEPEQARDLALALVRRTFQGKADLLAYAQSPLPLLEQIVRTDPDDLDAAEARAGILLQQRRFTEALAAFEQVLSRWPRRERSLQQAAQLAQQLNRPEAARDYWRRAVAANPWIPGYRGHLAQLLAAEHAWADCRRECEAWLWLDPANPEARVLAARCRAALGPPGTPGGSPP